MHVRSTAAGLEVLTPAKLNLFLEVLGKREDGFHEIETLMQPIGLYDTLYFRNDPSGRVRLVCDSPGVQRAAQGGESHSETILPEGPQNIVFRAIELIRSR